jgi:uncharacterized protein DUF4331
MSSHREAPAISKDPAADNTDLYAFVSPDKPNTVTILANFIPLQNPASGPNFWEFADDVLYEIHVSNRGDAEDDVTYQFRFTTTIRNTHTFLYNTGQITSITDDTWNRPQTYSVTRVDRAGNAQLLAENLTVPPVNIGPRSTPNYAALASQAVHHIGGGRTVFAGQRAEGFFVDLGSIFDLGTLRPFQHLHLIPSADAMGVNASQAVNVHAIAIQVPKADLARGGTVTNDPNDPAAVIGVYASASRRRVRVLDDVQREQDYGAWIQVSRLGNPLFNEVIVPMARKDEWNRTDPSADSSFANLVAHPELAKLLPVLYPGVFPNLAAYKKARADLLAILMTGIPSGVVPGFQNYTGSTQADLLRLNMAIRPSQNPSQYGILGGDLAGFPNGRRVPDNIVAIELRAVAGATIPLVDPSYTADGAAAVLTDGTSNTNSPYLDAFPYLGTPDGGYQTMPGTGGSAA